MVTYKLTVAYDGTDYHGWQWQPKQRSVDRILRETFLDAFHQKELYLVGASRTDAGVHAHGQVVRLITHLDLTPEKLCSVLNKALPSDIVITNAIKVDDSFHPQRNVKTKLYQYTFFTRQPDPFNQRFGTFISYPIDLQKLARALSTFVGTHDFKAFCKEEDGKETIRTIDSISMGPCEKTGGITISIAGQSFLRYMIRRIIGAALAASSKPTITIADLKQTLLQKKCLKVLPTAPAKGLCLKKIEYFGDKNE